jgi:hypothetical protein
MVVIVVTASTVDIVQRVVVVTVGVLEEVVGRDVTETEVEHTTVNRTVVVVRIRTRNRTRTSTAKPGSARTKVSTKAVSRTVQKGRFEHMSDEGGMLDYLELLAHHVHASKSDTWLP